MAALIMPRSKPGSRLRQLNPRVTPPTLMATPPTITTGAAPTLGRIWLASSGSGSYALASNPRGGVFTASRTIPITNVLAMAAGYTLTGGTAGQTAQGSLQVSFLHDGTDVELAIYAANGMLIRVDGEYVSMTPTVVAAQSYIKLAFGSRKLRRIDVFGFGLNFLGAYTGWTESLYPAPVRGPRVICLGDSFSTNSPEGWVSWFTDCMGWDDVWAAGVGGTGYGATASGASKKFRDRLASDVIAYNPDIVMVLGSINDTGQATATVQSEASALVSTIKASLPNCLVVGGYNATGGIEKMNAVALDVMDATKTGFISGGGVWLNPIEMPYAVSGSDVASTVWSAVAAGRPGNGGTPATVAAATSGIPANTNTAGTTNLPMGGAVVEIDCGAVRERIMVTATATASGKLFYGWDGNLQYAHAVGEPMVVKGASYLTGRGRVGATTGFGNADLYVFSDSVHPPPDGARALAVLQATMLRNYLGVLN